MSWSCTCKGTSSPSALANGLVWASQSWLLCSSWTLREPCGIQLSSAHGKLSYIFTAVSMHVLNPHVDLGVLLCSAKSTQLAEGLGGTAGSCSLDLFTHQNRKSVPAANSEQFHHHFGKYLSTHMHARGFRAHKKLG